MHTWQFSIHTNEKGVVSFKVKASSKQEAIAKAFTKVKQRA